MIGTKQALEQSNGYSHSRYHWLIISPKCVYVCMYIYLINFLYMGILLVCMSVYQLYSWCLRSQKRVLDPLKLEFTDVVEYEGAKAQALCKSNRCS